MNYYQVEDTAFYGIPIFSLGALALVWFIIGLKTGWSLSKDRLDYAEDNTSKKV